MRQRQTFILSLLVDDAEPSALRGRVRHVASETELLFSGADQLVAFLRQQRGTRPLRRDNFGDADRPATEPFSLPSDREDYELYPPSVSSLPDSGSEG